MHNIIIGQTNISDYIVHDTYKMDAKAQYESWRDGNYVEHRIIITEKIEGEFNVVCSNLDGSITLADFMDIISAAENNGVITCNVYVTNKGVSEAIDAYYAIDNESHTMKADGTFVDVLKVSLKER